MYLAVQTVFVIYLRPCINIVYAYICAHLFLLYSVPLMLLLNMVNYILINISKSFEWLRLEELFGLSLV